MRGFQSAYLPYSYGTVVDLIAPGLVMYGTVPVVVLNFYGPGRHLVIDAVISTVYRNTILSVTSLIPGHVAKLAEDKKFKADEMSSQPVSCKHGVIMFLFLLLWRTAVAHWELMHTRS